MRSRCGSRSLPCCAEHRPDRAWQDERGGLDTDRPGAAFEPGIALGRFSTEEAAQRALGELGRKGVRTARVVPERRDSSVYQLRLPQADAALRAQVLALGPALAGKPLHPCD